MMRRPAFALAIALSFCSMDGEAAPQDAALPKLAAGAGTSAAPFDINTIVPDSFRAMAVRIPEGLTPKIDGRLDDEAWRLGHAAGRLLSARARLRAPSIEKTEFRVLYDDKTIYFGVWSGTAMRRASSAAR